MAHNATEERTHNQPSHEAQVKGGEHSHKNQFTTAGNAASHNQTSDDAQMKVDQGNQNRTNEPGKSGDGRSHKQPSHEAQVKGGRHSHAGSPRR